MKRTQKVFKVEYESYSPHQPEEPLNNHKYLWALNIDDAKKEFNKIHSSLLNFKVLDAYLETPNDENEIIN